MQHFAKTFYGNDYMSTRKSLNEFMNMYVVEKKDLDNRLVAPLKAKSFRNLPETLIITCKNDPLRDEGREYARKLQKHSSKVKHIEEVFYV